MNRQVNHDRKTASAARQGGFSLLELAIASALVAFLLTMCVQMLRTTADQERATERRVVALQTVQNVAEQIEAMPFDRVNAEAVEQIKIPASAMVYLADAQLRIQVAEEQEPSAKRAAIELTWRDRFGMQNAPLRLTVWRYPNELPR